MNNLKSIFDLSEAEIVKIKFNSYCIAPSCAYPTNKKTYPYCAMHAAEKDILRWVYGTADETWHLVNKNDRDFSCGISQKAMNELGFTEAKEVYLQAKKV